MLTKTDFCDYDTCVALWSMGLIPHPYDNTDTDKAMAIISLYEAQKWLREEKKIGVFVSGFIDGYTFWIYNFLNGGTLYQGFFDNETGKKYKSYEKALSEGIKEAVKILKENETILR